MLRLHICTVNPSKCRIHLSSCPILPLSYLWQLECKHWRMGLGKQAGTKRNNANITPVALEHLLNISGRLIGQ